MKANGCPVPFGGSRRRGRGVAVPFGGSRKRRGGRRGRKAGSMQSFLLMNALNKLKQKAQGSGRRRK